MEYNYGVNSSTIRSKDGSDKSISLIHKPLKEDRRTTPTANARRNSLGPLHLDMEDDIMSLSTELDSAVSNGFPGVDHEGRQDIAIMSLIGIQDRNGSADMQSVFGMVSYSTS